MNKRVQITAIIDGSLRFALFGLECAMRVEFSVKEIERVFTDCRDSQTSAKGYLFFADGDARVDGIVEEFEPETIELILNNTDLTQQFVDWVAERTRYQKVRLDSNA